ncbi:protein kinase C-binding protein 1-like [Tropilaelaps mercedesae]|uniref:Protein kinase C-binding protein 1-like n=1 Tax=Tropilaelaps mercedesae TaxID=418985 RepID=A0A1V9XYA0_9ACAR|nr:protein kinase C-binding protein 1-like [Tropilaelaps mercedesae]
MPSLGGTVVGSSSSSSSSPEKRSPPKAKRPRLSVTIEMPEGNDRFCWKCHAEDANVPCTTCQRSFHEYCVPPPDQLHQFSRSSAFRPNQTGSSQTPGVGTGGADVTPNGKSNRNSEEGHQPEEDVQDLHNFVCPECLSVIRAERDRREGRERGPIEMLDKKQLAEHLLVAVRSIRPYALEVFHAPVSLEEYPDYKDFVVKPFDLQQLEQMVSRERYSSVEEFVSDLRWIHHNSVVYNGPQNRISSSAVAMLKAADKEVGEMSLCPQCYLHMRKATAVQNQTTSPNAGAPAQGAAVGGFFSEVCSPPHIIVWAKIRGFPHWPAKVMRVDGDQATVKFFGDHNKSLVSLGNCTLLTLKPPVNQKSKKGSYSTAMDEIATYVRKYRERFGIEFQYQTDQIKLTRETYERLMKKPSVQYKTLLSATEGGDQGSSAENADFKRTPGKSAIATLPVEATVVTCTEFDRMTQAAQADKPSDAVENKELAAKFSGDNTRAEDEPAGKLNATGGSNSEPLIGTLPMDVSDEREDEEGEEERRIKSVIISQVPLLADNDDDDKDSGSEEQNSILESIKRKLNLDKKSDSTDDDKEENGSGKELIIVTAAATAVTASFVTPANSSKNSTSSNNKESNKQETSNYNDTIVNVKSGDKIKDVTPCASKREHKLDTHPDLQLQQMQATPVIIQSLGRQYNNPCSNNNTSANNSSSDSGNIRNERKAAHIGDSPEKSQREARPNRAVKDHQQVQQQQLNSQQYNCLTKDEKDNSNRSNGSRSNNANCVTEVKNEVKESGRSLLTNAAGSGGRKESSRESREHMNNSTTSGTDGQLSTVNERCVGQPTQQQRARVRPTRIGGPQEPEDLESPASPPSAVPLSGGLVVGVENANLLAAAAAIGIAGAGAALAATGPQAGKTRSNMRAGGSGHFGTTSAKGVLAGGVLAAVSGLLGVEDTPKSPERTNCCAEVSSTTADTDPPQAHPASNATNQNAVTATTTVIPKVASGDTFFEKLRQTIEECKEKVGVTGHLNAQLQPIAGAALGPHPEDEDQEDEEGHDYDESETDVSDTELMPYQQKALQLPSPRKESAAPPGDETALLSLASSQRVTHRETQTGDASAHSISWTSDDWALHYWNAPRVHPDDKRLNQELVAREMCLLKDKLKLKELAAHKALWQASTTRMTDVVKSKQWCCVCKGLATMTCCWNTSYCSQACQSSHWPVHIKTCERSQQTSKR